jgi:hypothetical protein
LRREERDGAAQTENGAENEHTLGDGEGGVEQGTGSRARSGRRRVLELKSRALSLVRLESRKSDPHTLMDEP